jgi:iron complex transport system substrate-binding protein
MFRRFRRFRRLRIALGVALFVAVFGCKTAGTKSGQLSENQFQYSDSTVLQPRYAKGFRWEAGGDGLILVLTDPWNPGTVFARYRLLDAGSNVPAKSGITDISIPSERLAVSSTTHAGFLSAIGAGDCLVGCNNPDRLYDSVLYNRYLNGSLSSIGRDLELNLESLIAQKPSLVMQSGIEGQFNPDPRLTEMGIPVLYILEWMESTPLGRAEWIRVFGKITGHLHEADSVFGVVEKEYNRLSSIGRACEDQPVVFTGNNFKGTWYMPGGLNYLAFLFKDAGMDYPWKDAQQSASLALNFETVVNKVANAPLWVGAPADSLSQLLAEEERYVVFRAVREKRVYTLTNRLNGHGGNDYWESGVVRPDRILADLLYIGHPELVPGHSWTYYKPLIFN